MSIKNWGPVRNCMRQDVTEIDHVREALDQQAKIAAKTIEKLFSYLGATR